MKNKMNKLKEQLNLLDKKYSKYKVSFLKESHVDKIYHSISNIKLKKPNIFQNLNTLMVLGISLILLTIFVSTIQPFITETGFIVLSGGLSFLAFLFLTSMFIQSNFEHKEIKKITKTLSHIDNQLIKKFINTKYYHKLPNYKKNLIDKYSKQIDK